MNYLTEINAISHFINFGSEPSQLEERRESVKPRLLSVISELRKKGHALGGGILACEGTSLFWGDLEFMMELFKMALDLYNESLERNTEPLKVALTHIMLSDLYKRALVPWGKKNLELQAEQTYHRSKVADIFISNFKHDAHKEAYLISGFLLFTDLADKWEPHFVEYEVDEGHTLCSDSGWELSIPGAFQLLIKLSEYERALEVAELAPDGFRYPGVCGWREVCRGTMASKEAYLFYEDAAKCFASDTNPEDIREAKKPYWTAFNSGSLAPYFRARAALSKPRNKPEEVIVALKQAAKEIHPEQSGFVYGPSIKLATLVHGLGSYIETYNDSVLDKLCKDYQEEIRLWGESNGDDKLLLEGLKLVSDAIEGFRYDPVAEIGRERLSKGIRILETIPEWSQLKVVSGLITDFKKSALEVSQGATSDDVASWLGTITDEAILQRLLLHLLQASSPYHAKVTHGPIEFGKDIVAIIDNEGTPVLHLYAVKAGDIDARKWLSAKESIDQIFTVSINNPLVTQYSPTKTKGFLLFNGHFNQHIESVADGWLKELRSNRHWDIEVYDLNGLSKWIVSNRLVRVLRKKLNV